MLSAGMGVNAFDSNPGHQAYKDIRHGHLCVIFSIQFKIQIFKMTTLMEAEPASLLQDFGVEKRCLLSSGMSRPVDKPQARLFKWLTKPK
ncbi:hypothetical protein C4D60_Mb11t20380 [Musa balbisiana]|uniref:Uncharacterized protein n=1 Tax=Musa balbisiana TaxID=52838 RepID=A0A4S8J5J1_MUSBA|nr:hypothetical protein C4D60_Mb11t20380 [Musa balbisiana]